ncbi:MAG: HlyD family efflux transporter periplasmic adaptor subunit, partial [Desulfovibrio sp.]|nr:HlyD family efflux transporter periplasmic adaptor subunit [Desulfovibrio sp.]
AGTVSRIAAVRHEEERKKQAYDTAVMRHVQAELAMRSAEVRYGIGSSEYRKYQAQEESARIHKQRAEESFEKAAKVRAALNQELSRIRYEIQEAKKYASVRRAQSFREPMQKRIRQESIMVPNPPETLCSPTDGEVLKVNAQPGDTVEKGKPLVMIAPRSPAKGELWVEAWFNAKDAPKLQKGLGVRVEKADGSSFYGIVKNDAVLANLPQGAPRGDSGQYVSAHIDVQGTPGLKTGDKVHCKLEHRP